MTHKQGEKHCKVSRKKYPMGEPAAWPALWLRRIGMRRPCAALNMIWRHEYSVDTGICRLDTKLSHAKAQRHKGKSFSSCRRCSWYLRLIAFCQFPAATLLNLIQEGDDLNVDNRGINDRSLCCFSNFREKTVFQNSNISFLLGADFHRRRHMGIVLFRLYEFDQAEKPCPGYFGISNHLLLLQGFSSTGHSMRTEEYIHFQEAF